MKLRLPSQEDIHFQNLFLLAILSVVRFWGYTPMGAGLPWTEVLQSNMGRSGAKKNTTCLLFPENLILASKPLSRAQQSVANELQDDALNFYPHTTMLPIQGQLEVRMTGFTYEPGLPNNTENVVSAVVNMIISVVLRKCAGYKMPSVAM